MVERALEQVRRQYGFFVTGYVVMPEHVHLLVSEPRQALLSGAIQSLKQAVARRLALRASELVLLKSSEETAGLVDPLFSRLADGARFAIRIVNLRRC